MSTSTTPRPRVKPARSIRLVLAPTPTMPGIVCITVGRSVTDYHLEALASDYGRAFRLTKILGEHDSYHVNLNGRDSSCECLGHQRHGHCKHVEGLTALRQAGRL